MLSKRQNQVGRLIQCELAELLLKEGKNWLPGKLLTVTAVRMSPDLGVAKVYLSIFPSGQAAADLNEIKKQYGHIRHVLGDSIKNQMKRIPELIFYIDDTLDYVQRIDDKLNPKS